VSLKRELVEQRRLFNLPLTHHRCKSPAPMGRNESAILLDFNSRVFQHNLPISEVGLIYSMPR
jgi:hypothetical protein